MNTRSFTRPRLWAAALAMTVVTGVGVLAAAPAATADEVWHRTAHAQVSFGPYVALDSVRYSADTVAAHPSGGLEWTVTTYDYTSGGPAHYVDMTGRIVDGGAPSAYWTKMTLGIKVAGGGVYTSLQCAIYSGDPDAGGTALDLDTASPYTCASTDWTYDPSHSSDVPVPGTLESLDWATVQGVVEPKGDVSLGDGRIESRNRLIIDGAAASIAHDYHTVTSGTPVIWTAYKRNAEAEDTVGADATFAYRIYDSGAPTGYWVLGEAINERSIVFKHTASCVVYQGDPLAGGVPATVTPYVCDTTPENISGAGYWQVTFAVQRDDIVDVGPAEAARLIRTDCVAGECVFVPTSSAPVFGDVIHGAPQANRTGTEKSDSYEFSIKKGTTSSFETTVSTEADFFDIFKSSVEMKYGVEISERIDQTYTHELPVPKYSVAWLDLRPGFTEYTGDYLIHSNGVWYRASGITYTVPIKDGDGSYMSECAGIKGLPYDPADCAGHPPVVDPDGGSAGLGGAAPTGAATPIAGSETSAARLAETGGTAPVGLLWGAFSLLGLGSVLVTVPLVARRRSRRPESGV
ncbi:MAG: hypothetical protein J0I70_01030 [Microbacterium sp.]|uniref:hypothetical protein n=1 Tax=Microbacterium sp. TaxID=51671 RepID=UPI001AC4A6AE|nr:hypothetical protein [Microbacterium sp.]MBN9172722.1 hypothetical protein [Microbacterium sp.]